MNTTATLEGKKTGIGIGTIAVVGLGLWAWSTRAKPAEATEPEPEPEVKPMLLPLVRTIADFAELYGLSYGATEVLVARYREDPESEEFASFTWQQLVDLAYLAGLPPPESAPEPTPPEPEPTPPTTTVDPCKHLKEKSDTASRKALSLMSKVMEKTKGGWHPELAPKELIEEYRAATYAYLDASYDNCCCQRQRGHKLNCEQIRADRRYQWLSWVGY